MRPIKFKSIQSRLTFWFLLLSLAPLLIGILITFRQQSHTIEQRTYDKLTAIRDLKVQQLNNWLNGIVSDIQVMAGDYEIRELEISINKVTKTSGDLEKIAASKELLNRNKQNYRDYEEIFIIDAKTGLIILSTQEESEGENKALDPFFTIPLKTGEIYIKNFYYSETLDRPQMTISAPIYCLEHNAHILGILVARIDLDHSLYKLLDNRVGLGESGETLLINKEVIALNNLRHYENAPLNLKIKAEPAVRAAAGETGIVKTLDYRDIEVLAAYTYIPRTGWGFICKQDIYEVKEPIRSLLKKYTILYLISIIVIVFIVLWIIKIFSTPIFEMNVATQEIKKGDYTVRTKVKSKDELGSLANSINEMAASIETANIIQKRVAGISETMIELSSMKKFGKGLLGELMQITKANMAVFYVLNEANSKFEHFASIGANEKLLESFSSTHPIGEFGNAISKKEIVYLREIPDDSLFHYNTSAGDLIPKEIITIPVLIENDVVAIISLVNIHKFKNESSEIIKLSWMNINSFYSNLLANERTRILAEGLSKSNQKLEAQSEELQEQAEELQEQATELRHSSEELQIQNLKLDAQKTQVEEANRLKSEFLSNMSHELRTPLNSINALSQVLITQSKNKLNDDENSYLEIIERNGKRLLALINSILDLSKIEAGKIEIMPQAVSIKSLLNNIVESTIALTLKSGISLELNVDENLPLIETDESRIHQVLLNIISNAIKFTNNGSVSISAKQENENIIVGVKDTGIGISEEMIPHIFDEFRQADGSSSRQYEGTGLGLAIAKKLITVLGGTISVDSKLEVGSHFIVKIPIKWEAEYKPKDAIILQTLNPATTKKTILVVDDDKKIVSDISGYLGQLGYNTIRASTGKEALQLAEKYHPFAITLDIIMPEMDGWEVLQKLKANSETKDIPVIIVSVSDERDTGFALGAVGYINKPVNKQSLISEIIKLHQSAQTIMIVDDNEYDLKQMAEIIEAENINTILARSGEESIELMKKNIPDILVLDLLMTGIDGFQVLKEMRKNEQTKNVPVIVVSAKDITPDDKKRLHGKISSLIAKSDSTPQELYKEIKRILSEIEIAQQSHPILKNTIRNRILMVEDNNDAITQMKSILERENFIVDVVTDGQAAIDYIQHTIPDGIILDLMMPGIDGFEVLENIRASEASKNIPVLILTAKDLTAKDLSKLSSNNIQQLILKGNVDIEALIFRINLMMGRRDFNSSNAKEDEYSTTKTQINKYEEKKKKKDDDIANLLVIEDNKDNMATIQAILKAKYRITEAFDGEEGIKLAQSELPDMILLDISLPKIKGEKVLQILKTNITTKNIPVIVITARAMIGDKEKFLAAGCDDFVAKPIDAEELKEKISKLLGE